MSEVRSEIRLDHLEEDMREIKAILARLEPMIIRIDERLTSTLPHLATKEELADKPGKTYLATAIGVLLVAYAAGLAGLAALPVLTKLVQ
jgi:hypothetical protein